MIEKPPGEQPATEARSMGFCSRFQIQYQIITDSSKKCFSDKPRDTPDHN